MQSRHDTILVLGGTGKTGRRVAQRLHERGVPVRVGSRSGEPPFDWEDRSTWAPALEGVSAAYVTYYPDLAVPGAPEAIAAFSELAIANGVRRLVLLSGRGEPEAQRSEEVLIASGADWTIVRSSWFSQNFSEGAFLEQVLAGEVAMPADGVREPFVDAEDIADVAVAALTEDGHVGKLYELTGSRLLTFADAIAEIAEASGREIAYVPAPFDAWAAELARQEYPDDVVALLSFLFREVLDGRNEQLADGVRQALGRDPRDFSEFARAEAAAGTWTP